MRFTLLTSCLFAQLLITGCSPSPAAEALEVSKDKTYVEAKKTEGAMYSITWEGAAGLKVGQSISGHLDILRKGTVGLEETTVYHIIDEKGKSAGYVLPDADDPNLIEAITITSSDYVTTDGISIGWKLAEVLRRYPELIVQRDQLKGHLLARKDNFLFRFVTKDDLDVYDPAVIAETAYLRTITVEKKVR